MTQSELGNKLNVSDKSVSKWECGVNAPDISILNELATILGVTTTELLNGERNNKEVSVESIRFYNGRAKIKYMKYFFGILILISFLFSTLFLINNYNQFQVYTLSSNQEDFVVSGYILFNHKMNIIMINEIEYIDRYIGTKKEIVTTSIDIFLKYNNEVLYTTGTGIYHEEEPKSLSEYINNKTIYVDNMYMKNDYIDFKKGKLNYFIMEICYVDIEGKKGSIEVPLYAVEEISSTKLFY